MRTFQNSQTNRKFTGICLIHIWSYSHRNMKRRVSGEVSEASGEVSKCKGVAGKLSLSITLFETTKSGDTGVFGILVS